GGEKYNQYDGYYKPDNQHGQILYLLCLMQVPVYAGTGFSYQHVHVGALLGLLDMVEIEPHVTARCHGVGCLPVGPAPCKFVIGNMQMQSPVFHVQLNLVTVLYQRQGAANGGFGGDVQHHRTVGRAAHASVGNTHHVLATLLGQFFGQVDIAHFRHTRIAFGADPLKHNHAVRGDLQQGVVNARVIVFHAFKHHGGAAMLHKLG